MAANGGVKITVSGGGSGNGIKALIDGTTDIAIRPVHQERGSRGGRGEQNLPGALRGRGRCTDPVVHPSNPSTF
jgi:phosphate transport system substrate-binding protein